MYSTIIVIGIFISFVSLQFSYGNIHIVCKTCADYDQKTENCEYNYDVLSDVASISERHGFKHESYNITTEDGIRTPIYRILPRNKSSKHNTPVFIQHGLQMDATVWVSIGNRSLAFQLSDMGYDVWLGNFRNGHHSSQVHYDPNRNFYNFSFHELGNYDLHAQIEFVGNKTNRRGDIIFVGHSMGTTGAFIYSIDKKKDAERNLRVLIALGPPAYLSHCPHFFDGKYLTYYMLNYGRHLGEKYGYGALMDISDFNRYAVKFCTGGEYSCKFCIALIQFVAGYDYEQLAEKDMPVVLSYSLYPNPLKNILNYITMSHYDNSARYYYQMTDDNYDVYDYKQIKLPVYIFYGTNDKFGPEKDVLKFYEELETEKAIFKISTNNSTNDFNHIDFIWAKDIEPFHKQLFEVVKKFTN